jgi:hypothetical protein
MLARNQVFVGDNLKQRVSGPKIRTGRELETFRDYLHGRKVKHRERQTLRFRSAYLPDEFFDRSF